MQTCQAFHFYRQVQKPATHVQRRISTIRNGRHPDLHGRRSLSQASFPISLLASSSNDDITEQLSSLYDEITRLNNGSPVNVRSPKQVSTAIFGSPQTATKSILMQVANAGNDNYSAYSDLEEEKKELARLVLEYRELMNHSRATSEVNNDSDPNDMLKVASENLEQAEDSLNSVDVQDTQNKMVTTDDLVESFFSAKQSKIDPYWKEPLSKLSKSTARALLEQLDPFQCPMGYDPSAVPRGSIKKPAATTTAGKKGSFLSFCRQQKQEYPQCVLLVRCGDFYETFGLDAIMLIEHLGLNSMAGKARAGCPYRNIQPTLNGLTQEGFTVAVFEETGSVGNNKLKSRFLSQIVSPASPTYLYDNWLLGGGDHTQHGSLEGLPPSRPCVGIVQTAAGYNLVEVSLEERSVAYSERLTAEAVACRLAAYPPADPLIFIPSTAMDHVASKGQQLPFLSNARSTTIGSDGEQIVESSMGGYRLRTRILPAHLIQKPLEGISDSDRYIKAVVDNLVDINWAHFDQTENDEVSNDRPTVDDFVVSLASTATNPLYVETANQLGLLDNPSIPSLASYVLDEAAPAPTRHFLKRYLLVPPPPSIARSMSELVESLLNPYANPLPPLTVPPIGKVLSLIRAGQASANIYGELLQTLSNVELVLAEKNGGLPTAALLALCEHESGIPCSRDSLVQRCNNAVAVIESVISSIYHVTNSGVSENDRFDSITMDDFVSDAFFERNEAPWRGRIQRKVAMKTYSRVENAAQNFRHALASDFISDSASNKALIIHDFYNNLIALKQIPNTHLKKEDYFHPKDRNGKLLRNRYTTTKVQTALDEYIAACDQACEEVSTILSNLSKNIQEEGHIPAIVQASHLNLILSTAYHHAVKASKQKWNLAEVLDDTEESNIAETGTMHMKDVWPYWMPKTQAVPNTFDLNGLFLLTAPNMSGKSTIMRSTAAAALLSICGFCAPLSRGSRIPRFDTLFLRGASADVPTEDKSAFGAEMGDIAALMRCCGPKSLIFVDELGRGTSPRDGTRLAGAVLEAMAQQRMNGIFATHLHDILDLPLNWKDRIANKRLALEEDDGSYKWTYRLEDGVCKDSLALVTAARFGVPDEIIRRAEELAQYLPEAGNVAIPQIEGQDAADQPTTHQQGRSTESATTKQDDIEFRRAIDMAEELTGQPSISIPPRWSAPPALCSNQSCVYVMELNANPPSYYVGETDSLSQRLKKHRSKGAAWSSARAVALPVSDKSEARAWESQLIQKMVQAGFRMESITDGRVLRHL
ncbi:unnamed protein product [Cylindrotheca closterium]|uniref:DNA mismatch repair proteins mutS family domain-containing protein n=1 Tax=Cylindrotheca closterium TaxID=2856 RepID=A0AAD2GB53_9STRA|nr:unnamed protein product [Cylindrotheca closterium]